MWRIRSPLTAEQEQIVESTVDAALCVHRALGPGFREVIYKRLLKNGLQRIVY